MLDREAKRNGSATASALAPWKFGAPGRDPAEFGRRGGIASGQSRRQREQRELERRIRETTKNGAALYGLLRLHEEREQDLRDRRAAADEKVMQAYVQLDQLQEASDRERRLAEHIASA